MDSHVRFQSGSHDWKDENQSKINESQDGLQARRSENQSQSYGGHSKKQPRTNEMIASQEEMKAAVSCIQDKTYDSQEKMETVIRNIQEEIKVTIKSIQS